MNNMNTQHRLVFYCPYEGLGFPDWKQKIDIVLGHGDWLSSALV